MKFNKIDWNNNGYMKHSSLTLWLPGCLWVRHVHYRSTFQLYSKYNKSIICYITQAIIHKIHLNVTNCWCTQNTQNVFTTNCCSKSPSKVAMDLELTRAGFCIFLDLESESQICEKNRLGSEVPCHFQQQESAWSLYMSFLCKNIAEFWLHWW